MNLSITNKCNRRCEYCFQKTWYLSNNDFEVKEMSLDTIQRIIDMFEEKHFKIMGGEPLLYSKLFELLELLRRNKKTITFISNITVETDILKRIITEYKDVATAWLINSDYPDSQEKLFLKNIKLFSENNIEISLSTTLLPDENKIIKSVYRLNKILKYFNRDKISIRLSPMAPNHISTVVYNYSLDIIKFLECLWKEGLCKVSFDCPLNCCEVHPEVLNMFDRYHNYIEYKNNICCGCGAFDVLLDNSVIYCSSSYNLIRLDNIFDYNSIEIAKKELHKKWKEYWRNNTLNCDYRNCEHFNPVYCLGLCPAKNNSLLK